MGDGKLKAYFRENDYLRNGVADIQFGEPSDGTIKERHALPEQEQRDLFAKGYSPETRFWIDDMYMITALQS